jgi:hypothetical protein
MEKGRNYLVLIHENDKKTIIREIECLESTKTCYKILFKSTVKNTFYLDMFNEKILWIQKKEFNNDGVYEVLEELPIQNRSQVMEALESLTKDTTINELFGIKKDECDCECECDPEEEKEK